MQSVKYLRMDQLVFFPKEFNYNEKIRTCEVKNLNINLKGFKFNVIFIFIFRTLMNVYILEFVRKDVLILLDLINVLVLQNFV